MATKTSEARNAAFKKIKASKEILTKQQVLSKLKDIGKQGEAIKEFRRKGIPIPKSPKAIDVTLGDITRLEGPALGRKYAEFVEYYNWVAYELAVAEVTEMSDEIVFDHTFSIILLEDVIQQLTSREDRDAASKSHKETVKVLVSKDRSHTRAHLLRAISNGLLKKVDALSREITRRQGFERHHSRKHSNY